MWSWPFLSVPYNNLGYNNIYNSNCYHDLQACFISDKSLVYYITFSVQLHVVPITVFIENLQKLQKKNMIHTVHIIGKY